MSEHKYVSQKSAIPVDGLEKVLGTAKYVGDIKVAGMLHAKVLRSHLPHAMIKKIDLEPALKVKGVKAAITCQDFVDNGSFGWPVQDAYVLAYKKVRYVGDPIAVVAAETEEAAVQGVKAIICELESLRPVTDMEDALNVSSPLVPLTPNLGEGNLVAKHVVRNGDPESYFQDSHLLFEQTYHFAHQEHAYIETEGAVAIPEPDGGVTVFANDQSLFVNRGNVSAVLGLETELVRIIQPPVGGSFGGKDDIGYQTSAQAAKLAQKTRLPVRLVLGREESMAASYKREAMQIRLKYGADKDGKLKAVKSEILADSGGYASMTPLSAWRATMHVAGAYQFDAAEVDTNVVYTNNGYSGAFRGFGNTQAASASEVAIDEISALVGKDPIDYRLENCLKTGDHAFTGNKLIHEVALSKCLNWVRNASDWDTKRAQTQESTNKNLKKGIGVACYFHGAGLGGEGIDYAKIILTVQPDNTILLQSGLTDYGQGSRTVFTLLAAEYLGINPEQIVMPRPDTLTALDSGPTVASRASIVGGNAVRVASSKLINVLNLSVGQAMNCDPAAIKRFGEKFISPNEDEMSFDEAVNFAREIGMQLTFQGYWEIPRIHWDFDKGTGVPYFTYSYGAQAAEVVVNTKTGAVSVTGIWAAHDGGKIIFPNGAKGQLLGGITQGIGYALTEGFTYHEGVPDKLNFDTYTIPKSTNLPEIVTHFIDSSLPEGPFGAKNMAEPVMIATAPAIINAIYHATGKRIRTLPVDPAKLKQ